MLKNIFEKMIQQDPDEKHRYVFINDNMEIMQNVVAIGYSTLWLTEAEKNAFSLDGFKEYIKSIINTGTNLMDYVFVPACFRKKTNDELEVFFKSNGIVYKQSGYTLFRNKEYLGNYNRQEELDQTLKQFINRFEGQDTCMDLQQFHNYDENGKCTSVCDVAIVEYLMDTEDMFVIDGIAFVYENGVFKEDANGIVLMNKIQACLYRNEIKAATIKRVYDLLIRQQALQSSFETVNNYPKWWINFKNGMLDVQEMKIHPHSPEYRSMNQIPHEFSFQPVKGENTLKFLKEAVPDSGDRQMFYTYLGYCMTCDTSMQKFMMIKGEGGTGKSRLIALAEYIVGKPNYVNVSLADLNERFYPSNLFGKLMNSCADISTAPLNAVDVLKKCTGDDEIIFERKGMDANRSFRSYAKLLFSANKIPLNLDEKSNAFYRRLLILEMNVKPAKIDLRLDEKLQSEVQFSIFMAVRWLHEMYEKGHIPESENSKRLVNELYKDADSVKAWLEDCMKPAAGARCSRTVLYDLYDKYCEENDRQAIGRAKFYKNLVDKGYKEGKDRTVGRYIEGLDEKGEDFVDAQAAGVEVPFK
ncbi:phage/plasmid primase, P4 family [Coprococcus catus]|uniref:DNA primase family protein n=1 Tax=Coprococcus catus TaxID=116085 RepID=UPI001D06D732|nr:phage/plasmid primase, P4 family [Coprococcus catus]MCB6493126.1 phage/plasmid primase, P4 family [Coprococcus catus]